MGIFDSIFGSKKKDNAPEPVTTCMLCNIDATDRQAVIGQAKMNKPLTVSKNDNGGATVYYDRQAIGDLPAAEAQRFAQDGITVAYIVNVKKNFGMCAVPQIKIQWRMSAGKDTPGTANAERQTGSMNHTAHQQGIVKRSPIDHKNERAVLGLTRYAVIDVETTGLSSAADRIIEIGIVTVDNGEVTKFTSYVDPQMHIPKTASEITGIYDRDVKGAPTYRDIAPTIRDMIDGFPLVAHNASFDIGFLERLFSSTDIDIELTYLDTLSTARRYVKGLENYKLGTLVKHFGIDLSNAHRAGDDAYATMQMFECIKREMVERKEREKEEKKAEKARLAAERARSFSKSPLYNLDIAFTGAFQTDRDRLEAAAESVGALAKKTVTGKTRYLVIGDLSGYPESTIAKKVGKADELIEKGQQLEKLNEQQFLQLIADARQVMGK